LQFIHNVFIRQVVVRNLLVQGDLIPKNGVVVMPEGDENVEHVVDLFEQLEGEGGHRGERQSLAQGQGQHQHIQTEPLQFLT